MPISGIFPRKDRTRVLFADPDVDARLAYYRLATREGFDVELARDGHEAIALARTRLPSVAVLETRLPPTDGIDVLNELRGSQRTRSTRIVLVYDIGEYVLGARVEGSGCDASLVRPHTFRALFRLLTIFQVGSDCGRRDDGLERIEAFSR